MKQGGFLSVTDQVTELLREGILAGRWRRSLPGRYRLSAELGVNHKTVETATRNLMREGLLVSKGSTRRREIVLPNLSPRARDVRVRILPYDRDARSSRHNLELLDELHKSGYAAGFALKSLLDLGMEARRVARFVERTPADAWIITSGSREVLEWFSRQPVPALALFGRFMGLPIAAASPRLAPAMIPVIRRLVELGHRRIVMLTREVRRKPFPGYSEQLFLRELESHGIKTGSYNLPDWGDDADGFRACLDTLFAHTPPTALILGDNCLFIATQQYLARRGIQVPDRVSLICASTDPGFAWCNPVVSHFHWDHRPVIQRVVRWVRQVARGREDRRQVLFDGEFIEGGTISPVHAGR